MLINPEEIDSLKLEAKRTIDMTRFVDLDQIDSHHFEKGLLSLLEKIEAEPAPDAVKLAVDLIEQQSGNFEPQKMPNEYVRAMHELVQAKVEQRAPEVEIETAKAEVPKVVNIMDALKKSMQAKGQAKVRDTVWKRMGKEPASGKLARGSKRAKPTTGARRSVH